MNTLTVARNRAWFNVKSNDITITCMSTWALNHILKKQFKLTPNAAASIIHYLITEKSVTVDLNQLEQAS